MPSLVTIVEYSSEWLFYHLFAAALLPTIDPKCQVEVCFMNAQVVEMTIQFLAATEDLVEPSL